MWLPQLLQSFPLVFAKAICQYVDMACIYCGGATRVANSRPQRSNTIWRRRKCEVCLNIFTTREAAALDELFMVRSSSSALVPFSRDKLFLTIYESCRHRPNAVTTATALTQTIINQLTKAHRQGILERDIIVHHAHVVLRRFDPVAATFYAAYYAAGDR